MLFYNFENYEEFKEIFGLIEHGNGVVSRKNKILLALYKDKAAFKKHVEHLSYMAAHKEYSHFCDRYYIIEHKRSEKLRKHLRRVKVAAKRYSLWEDAFDRPTRNFNYLSTKSLPALKQQMMYCLQDERMMCDTNNFHRLYLNNGEYFTKNFYTDLNNGICEDGTVNAIRYVNAENGKTFKMKAGKMFNHIMDFNFIIREMPEQIKRWLSEEWVGEWNEYANRIINPAECELHVDDCFSKIYNSNCYAPGNFHSCMIDDEQWTFYRDAVKAKAAYTTDNDGRILARCIIFTEVHEKDSDKIWRLAERQYSTDSNLGLQRQLIRKLIEGGHIDGYKKVGVSCHDASAFLDNNGNSLESKEFWISCKLHRGDTLSYQDSFKWYDEEDEVANNYGEDGIDDVLATTCSTFVPCDCDDDDDNHDDESWSDYNECYIPNDEAYYVETRGDNFYDYQVVSAKIRNSSGGYYEDWCFKDDCIEVDDVYYYAGCNCDDAEENGLIRCARCDSWMLKKDAYYSDYTEEYYCDTDCLEDAENDAHEANGDVWSSYDDEWLDSDLVIKAKEYCFGRYYDITISVESFNELVADNEATEYLGDFYIDNILSDGEPAHLGCVQRHCA